LFVITAKLTLKNIHLARETIVRNV